MKTLRIESADPALQMHSTRAQMRIHNKIRRFKVKRTPTRMKVENKRPKMKVNWKKTWAQMNLRSPGHLATYLKGRSRQAVAKAISKTVSEGNQVADLQYYMGTGQSPFASIAMQNMINDVPEVNVGSMPQSSPEVSWEPGHMHVEWEIGDVEIEWEEEFMPEFSVTPYSIDIRLQGRPEVHITVNEEEARYTDTVGRKVNRKV